jgi:hypothetical protein
VYLQQREAKGLQEVQVIALLIHYDFVTNISTIRLYARESLALGVDEAPTRNICACHSMARIIAIPRLLFSLLQDRRYDIVVLRCVKDSFQLLLRWCAQNPLCTLIGVEDLESYGAMRLDCDRGPLESMLTIYYIC